MLLPRNHGGQNVAFDVADDFTHRSGLPIDAWAESMGIAQNFFASGSTALHSPSNVSKPSSRMCPLWRSMMILGLLSPLSLSVARMLLWLSRDTQRSRVPVNHARRTSCGAFIPPISRLTSPGTRACAIFPHARPEVGRPPYPAISSLLARGATLLYCCSRPIKRTWNRMRSDMKLGERGHPCVAHSVSLRNTAGNRLAIFCTRRSRWQSPFHSPWQSSDRYRDACPHS